MKIEEVIPTVFDVMEDYRERKHLMVKQEVQEVREELGHLAVQLADCLGDLYEEYNRIELERKLTEKERWIDLKRNSTEKLTDKEKDMDSYLFVKDLLKTEMEYQSLCKRGSLILSELQHVIHAVGSRLKTLGEES